MQAINRHGIILMLLFSFFLHACIEPYNPELKQYKNQLVIYGLITNEQGPHQIKISRTIATFENNENPETGATVTIIDQDENSISLTETKAGTYITPNEFKGKINNQYKLLVTTKDGNSYESELVKLLEVPEISDLSAKFIQKAGSDYKIEYGYEFYVSINETKNSLKYYRWSFEETWELPKPFTVSYFWTGTERIDVNVPNSCWINREIPIAVIESADDYQVNTINEQPLVFVDNDEGRLSAKYCLHVKQFALSEQSYFYWKSLIANNEEQGSLYDKIPYQLVGNIENVNNPDEKVLGIFEASAVTYKRILVGRAPWGITTGIIGFEDCIAAGFNLEEYNPGRVYLSCINDVCMYYSVECIECNTVNGTLNKPGYWDEGIFTIK